MTIPPTEPDDQGQVLPSESVTSVAAVKAALGITDSRDDDDLAVVVAAVDSVVRSLPIADTALGADAWPSNIILGGRMLAQRLFRRKDSPDGVAAFGETGPVYIQRNDPDVALLLQLGAHKRPGIA